MCAIMELIHLNENKNICIDVYVYPSLCLSEHIPVIVLGEINIIKISQWFWNQKRQIAMDEIIGIPVNYLASAIATRSQPPI